MDIFASRLSGAISLYVAASVQRKESFDKGKFGGLTRAAIVADSRV
jgi:hypothetical protein